MPLQATSGAASYDAFGGGVPVVPNYIEDVFRTHLYNGDTGGFIFASSGVSIVSGGMMWVKSRGSATNNYIFSPSLTSANHYLNTNATAAQSNSGVSDNNFEAVDNGGGMRFGGAYSGISSSATGPFTSWTFRKQPKFFDVVTYTGTGANRTIAHSLGSVPGCIIVKRTDTTGAWQVYHRSLANTEYLVLNASNAKATGATRWNSTTATSSVFSVGTDATVNASGGTYVAYIFAHDAGGFGLTGADNVISCGTYTGNASAAGPIVTLGYEPQLLLVKSSSLAGESWFIIDTMRGFGTASSSTLQLSPASTAAEDSQFNLTPTATGFQVLDTNQNVNGSGQTYIYIAIRRGPMKVPTNGTSVFKPLTRTANNALAVTTGYGFAPDMMFSSDRSRTYPTSVYDKLRGKFQVFPNGAARFIETSSAGGEANAGNESGIQTFDNNGITFYTDSNGRVNSSGNYVYWIFGRAPSFFDQVCYTGTGANRTVSHNLSAVPELMIVKRREFSGAWDSYCSALANTEYIVLNTTAAKATGATRWNSTTPTSSVFSVGTSTTTNASGGTYVAYLFATCAGVSKVGSYTGNGTTQTIDCGFGAGGARFVLIKRTNSTGDWYVYDTARGMTVLTDPYMIINSAAAAETATLGSVTTVSTGFALNSTILAAINVSGGSYIFLAIA